MSTVFLLGRLEKKISLGRRRCIWDDNIKMDLTEVVYESVYCINLAENRVQWRGLMSSIMNFLVA